MLAHVAAAGLAFTMLAHAGPPLTTIQDVLYKADGSLFNGVAVISWKSFEAADASNITMQSTTVRILNGNLKVALVPNADVTPAVYYKVQYSSDGRIQFEEHWLVPAGTGTLRVREVRVAGPGNLEPGADTEIEESDVTGLVDDLAARPVKGPGYLAGRVAVIGAAGTLDAVAGSLSDCVRVDGSAGPCGNELRFIDAEIPAGSVDGVNRSFTLAVEPDPAASVVLYRNGVLQRHGLDFGLTGQTLEFAAGSIPQEGDVLVASYRISGPDAPGGSTAPKIICSRTGQSTSSAAAVSLGSCSITAGTLLPGDRVEIRFDYQHQGTGSGFAFNVKWGGTTIVQRAGSPTDNMVSGRAEAGITAQGAQMSVQSWGGELPLASGVANATDALTSTINVDFRGNLTAAGTDQLTLRQFSVIRFPGRP